VKSDDRADVSRTDIVLIFRASVLRPVQVCRYGIREVVNKWFKSFLDGRTQVVEVTYKNPNTNPNCLNTLNYLTSID